MVMVGTLIAESLRVGERAPHSSSRRPQENVFLDPVQIHMQPPDCILTQPNGCSRKTGTGEHSAPFPESEACPRFAKRTVA